MLNKYDKKKPNVRLPARVLHSLKKERRTIRKTITRRNHPKRKRRMKRRTAIQRRIGLPTRLVICVAKQATVSKSVQSEPLKMTTNHLS